jgi:tellurite resistance protein TerC
VKLRMSGSTLAEAIHGDDDDEAAEAPEAGTGEVAVPRDQQEDPRT